MKKLVELIYSEYSGTSGRLHQQGGQNSGFLRREMGAGNPIFDSYLKANGTLQQTGGFLNAERNLLQSRGWNFNSGTGAWMPPH